MTDTGIRHSHQRGHTHPLTADTGMRGGTFASVELRPEDVARWPITAEARDAITRDYDGDLGTARDIGQRLGGYPSWHIVAIAHALGVHEPRQRAHIKATMSAGVPLTIIEPRRPLTPTPTPTPTPEPPATPATPEKEEPVSQFATLPERSQDEPEDETLEDETPEAPETAVKQPARPYTREATCEQCGKTFTSSYSGPKRGWTRYCSSGCGGAAARQRITASYAPPTPPATTAAPVQVEAPVTPLAINDEVIARHLLAHAPTVVTCSPTPPPAPTITMEPDYLLARRRLRTEALHTLVDALPARDTWTDRERSRWLEAVSALLDFAIERRPDALDWRAGQ